MSQVMSNGLREPTGTPLQPSGAENIEERKMNWKWGKDKKQDS